MNGFPYTTIAERTHCPKAPGIRLVILQASTSSEL